ncbi:MAG: ankyrin repeat domain-containing protein [Spirochaetia bacterium]|jgi:ankyrin repeat protein
MRKRIVLAVVLAVLLAASAYAQTLVDLAAYGTPQDVQAAIDKGADANARSGGRTPLIVAATSNKHPEVITALLEAGADMEARDPYDSTALLWAAINGQNSEVIVVLLNAGADAKAKEGSPALQQLQEASK